MLYYLFDFLHKTHNIPGMGAFQYISTRVGLAVIVSLLISMVFGKKLIRILNKKQVGESIRDLGLPGQIQKEGTPTMGGLIIIGSIIVPTLLFAKLHNIYVILILITTVWLGMLGFADDYIKVFKKNKKGLSGKYKILGQVFLGLIIGLTMLYHKDIVIREKNSTAPAYLSAESVFKSQETSKTSNLYSRESIKSTKTTIPFLKNNELEYDKILSFMGRNYKKWSFLIFIPIIIIIVAAVSNGANITDGIDGLATSTSAIIGTTLGILAYVSGNVVFANYLNIMYIPDTGELTIFIGAFVGACIGFLWYNSYPAQVFMGDTGSLALGGIIAVFAIMIRKELLIPILCGVFLVENLSVIMQVSYFKYSKKKFGEGRRIFKMAPLHHHYQKLGYHESKIVVRFIIIGIMLAVATILTLKAR